MEPLTIARVAEITGKGKQTIRVALQHGILPYGTAFKLPGSSRYVYEIYPEKFYSLYGKGDGAQQNETAGQTS